MAPRALWTGTISFGLVNVPVRMYSATRERDLHFNYVHSKDGSRIGYEKVCKKEGVPVPEDEIVKAFEWEKGEWVYVANPQARAGAQAARQGEPEVAGRLRRRPRGVSVMADADARARRVGHRRLPGCCRRSAQSRCDRPGSRAR